MCKALKLGLLAFAVLGVTFLGCDKMAAPTDKTPDSPGNVTTASYVTDIIAGQSQVVGTITAYTSDEGIYLQYRTTGNWWLTEIQADVEPECEEGWAFPVNKKGNPQVGQFDYNSANDPLFVPPTKSYVVEFAWTEELENSLELCFAAHCVVKEIVDGEVIQTQTGWGNGDDGPGDQWWMYFCWDDNPIPVKRIKLPPYMIQVQYTQVSGSTPSMFQLAGITQPEPPEDSFNVDNGFYRSFCLDRTVYITPGWKNAVLWNVFYGGVLPIYIMYNRGTNDLTPYDKISYLADKFIDGGVFTDHVIAEYQHVFWYYRGIWSTPFTPDEQALYEDAETNGDGWRPLVGDWFAVPMDIGCTVQLCFIIVDP